MRVLLADDHQLMLEGLRSVLEAHGIEVVGMATDGLECLAEAREQHPDVILMEVAMPRCDGLRATRLVKSEMPEIQVIMLSATADDHDLFRADVEAGRGFLLKSMDAADLISALGAQRCATCPRWPGPGQPAAPANSPAATTVRRPPRSPIRPAEAPAAGDASGHDPRLTARQEDTHAAGAGSVLREVAARVWLTPRTIKYHMGEIMRKLHLDNRAQVLAYAGAGPRRGGPRRPSRQGVHQLVTGARLSSTLSLRTVRYLCRGQWLRRACKEDASVA